MLELKYWICTSLRYFSNCYINHERYTIFYWCKLTTAKHIIISKSLRYKHREDAYYLYAYPIPPQRSIAKKIGWSVLGLGVAYRCRTLGREQLMEVESPVFDFLRKSLTFYHSIMRWDVCCWHATAHGPACHLIWHQLDSSFPQESTPMCSWAYPADGVRKPPAVWLFPINHSGFSCS